MIEHEYNFKIITKKLRKLQGKECKCFTYFTIICFYSIVQGVEELATNSRNLKKCKCMVSL